MLSFQVLSVEDQVGLNLSPDNPDLIPLAALMGTRVTARVTDTEQVVISQNLVSLTLDCSHMLLAVKIDPKMPPLFHWERQRTLSTCPEGILNSD